MPPEQIRGDGDIGPRADGYALGHVAYALLTGEPYWKEEGSASPALYTIFRRVLGGVVEAPTVRARRRSDVTLPPAFDGWFGKATALEAADRFASASELVAALASALELPCPGPSRGANEPVSTAVVAVSPAAQAAQATSVVTSTHLAPRAASRSALPWLAGAALVVTFAAALALSLRSGPPAGAARGEVAAPVSASPSASAVAPDASAFLVDRSVTPPPGAGAPPAASASSPIVGLRSPHRPIPASAASSSPVPSSRGGRTGDYDPTNVR
jgi:hypothetical protein